jgi:hypothetical protein
MWYNKTNCIRLPTCFGMTSHHPQGRHTEHIKIQIKIHKPSWLETRYWVRAGDNTCDYKKDSHGMDSFKFEFSKPGVL